MTTNLTFTHSTTETLRGGTDYNINQHASGPGANDQVTLTFILPSTIDNDTISAFGSAGSTHQTLNFNIMNLTGTLSASHNGSATLNGDILVNNGTIEAAEGASIKINTKLLAGQGMEFVGGSNLTVNGVVGSGQTFNAIADGLPGNLILDNPSRFFADVNLPPAVPGEGGSIIDLVGLAAKSYDYSHDVLTLWNGNKIVDRLHMTTTASFNVYQTRGIGSFPSGVLITTDNSFLASEPGVTALPIHTGV